jgi:hypothetical protein
MDIAGAKALKERLGHNPADDDPVDSADVPEDAPPVYHYLGVSQMAAPAEDAPPAPRRSVWSRIRLRRN